MKLGGAGTTIESIPEVEPKVPGVGGGGDDFPGGDGFGGGGDRGGPERASYWGKYRLGMWLALAAITMMFMAFTSAYIFRQGFSADWRAIEMPSLLWLNTTVLLVSSFTIELARRSLEQALDIAFKRWLGVTAVLGIAFLAGQVLVWRQLEAKGIYLSTSPHSSFFYMLTAMHGLHLLGGIVALSYVVFNAWQSRFISDKQLALVDVTALYWHFMDGLWIYLFLLLFVWR